MRSIGMLSPAAITEKALREFVIGYGGEWYDDDGFHQGGIQRGQTYVLLYLNNEMIRECASDNDPPWPRDLMGFAPKSEVVLEVSRHDTEALDRVARLLAHDVASELATRWQGYVDWDEVTPP